MSSCVVISSCMDASSCTAVSSPTHLTPSALGVLVLWPRLEDGQHFLVSLHPATLSLGQVWGFAGSPPEGHRFALRAGSIAHAAALNFSFTGQKGSGDGQPRYEWRSLSQGSTNIYTKREIEKATALTEGISLPRAAARSGNALPFTQLCLMLLLCSHI